MRNRGGSGQGDLNGFLDEGSRIEGELHFEDTFRVEGAVKGKVSSEGELVVGEKGRVEGEVSVGRAFISGTVRGTVRAREKIEITPQGKVYANLETPALIIESGAFFQGECRMEEEKKAGP